MLPKRKKYCYIVSITPKEQPAPYCLVEGTYEVFASHKQARDYARRYWRDRNFHPGCVGWARVEIIK